jgi:mono/diheme cytochrome c family protein
VTHQSTRIRLGAIGIALLAGVTVPAASAPGSIVIGRRCRGDACVARRADTVDHHAVNAVVYNGWKMFEVYCTRCHGEDAVGSSFAPALIKSVGPDGLINHRAFFETVTHGRPTKGMPMWGNLLSPEQKEDVWNYLRARAVGGLAPGRPHIKPGDSRDSTALPEAVGQDTTWPGPPANS